MLQLKKLGLVILVRKQFLTLVSFKKKKKKKFQEWFESLVSRDECDISSVCFVSTLKSRYVFPPTQFAKFFHIYFPVYKDGERGVVLGGGGNYR